MPHGTRRTARLAAILVIVALAVGCLHARKATVDVADLASLFPTIERLGVGVYYAEEIEGTKRCLYFEDRRGAFMNPPDGDCQVFDFDGRHSINGSTAPSPIAFDQGALADLNELQAEFTRIGLPVSYLNLVLHADGSVGGDSAFEADRCVVYTYEPGWSTLPTDLKNEVAAGINEDWWRLDSCP